MKATIDLSMLDQRFLDPYLKGYRIVVDLPGVGERVGKVAVTGGPKPEFILLTNRTDHTYGDHVLNHRVDITGVYVNPRKK